MNKNIFIICLLYFLFYSVVAQENCRNGIDDDGDGLIDCYDTECSTNEDCIKQGFFISPSYSDITCRYDLPGSSFQMNILWQSIDLGFIVANSSFVAGDINNDNIPEVLAKGFSTTGQADSILSILDGKTGSLYSIINTYPYIINTQNGDFMSIADINKDGFGEIILKLTDISNANKKHIACYEYNGIMKWISTDSIPSLGSLGLADFNNDGIPEIYSGFRIYNSQNGQLIVSGPTIITPPYGGVIAADLLPDNFCSDCNGLEIASGNEVYSVDIISERITLRQTLSGKLPGLINIADYDGDDSLDIIVQGMPIKTYGLFAWNPRTGNLFASAPFPSLPPPDPGCFIASADFDHDDTLEFVVTNRWWITLFDSDMGTIIWRKNKNDFSGCAAATIFDFNCDGEYEIAMRDQVSLRIFDGLSGLTLDSMPCFSGTANEYPLILDVDGNGSANIVCGCDSNSSYVGATYIRAYRSINDDWASARKVWNQYMYHNTNINDDLSVPIGQQNHGNLPGKKLNGFSLQANLLDEAYQNKCYYELNDFSIKIDSADKCSGNIKLILCNSGPYYKKNIYINIYDDDLQSGGNIIYADSINNIYPDTCYDLNFYANKGQYLLYAKLSDKVNGSMINFNSLAECDSNNNIDTMSAIIFIMDSFYLGEDTSICKPDFLSLNVNVSDVNYLWSTGSVDSFINVYASGQYSLRLESNGCYRSDSIYVGVYDCDTVTEEANQDTFLIMNAFSPNGDKINDRYGVIIKGKYEDDFSMQVIDKLGKVIYSTNDYSARWDGTYQGKEMPSGIYLYDIIFNDSVKRTGNFILIR